MYKLKKVVCCLLTFLLVSNLCPNVTMSLAKEKNNKVDAVYEYYELISNKQYDELVSSKLLGGEYYNDVLNCINNEYNKINHVGIYNIKEATVRSIQRVIDPAIVVAQMREYDQAKAVYEVSIELSAYVEDEYLKNGTNKRYVILYGDGRILGNVQATSEEKAISTVSYDKPKKGIEKNPADIKVYLTNKKQIKVVGFEKYCKFVTVSEVGYNWNQNALNACALAIKNYGAARKYTKKYPDLGYDVKDSEADQVYNPDKAMQTNCSLAVSNIWDYYIYDANNGLIPAFHVHDKNVSSYAKKNGGVLSQTKSRDLANSGKNWEEIIKYFYNRKSGVSYYNTEVAVGNVKIVQINRYSSK